VENVEENLNPMQKYKTEVFDKMFSCVLSTLNDRFKAFQTGIEHFKFLFNVKNISSMSDEDLKTSCENLEKKLTDETKRDVSGEELQVELKSLASRFNEDVDPEKCLNFIYKNNLNEIYVNTSIALRIMLTLPITVASAERSFSKLKIIKNYLRSTMSQQRLNNLAMISIESGIANNLNIADLFSTL
jgi:hypothetical protein